MVSTRRNTGTVHIVIPDTQTKYGVATKHLEWVAQYIVDKFAGVPDVRIIMLGDHWDMPSLSSYDRKGGKLMEGRRYVTDVRYGNLAWSQLSEPLVAAEQRTGVEFDKHYLRGNHEERINRAINQDAQLEGLVGYDQLQVDIDGLWRIHDFLEPVRLDGVTYAHYFQARGSNRPLGGQSIDARIKTVGHSFTQGHTPGLWFGRREHLHGAHLGLVAGSCYLHDEEYMGHQGNNHWRGIVICYDVRQGDYDIKPVSLNSLCQRYEGKSLGVFKGRH